MNISIANRLVELRKLNGYSQEALAEKIGISRQAISKWERAEASPDTDNLMSLATLYGMTLDDLLNAEGDKVVLEGVDNVVVPVSTTEKAKAKVKEIINSALYPEVARKMFKFPYPVLVAIVYVAIGYFTDLWHPAWLIFLTIPVYYMIAAACRTTSKKAFLFVMPVPILVVMAFLGFNLFALEGLISAEPQWGITALLYLIIPLYYWFVAFYVKGKNKKDK